MFNDIRAKGAKALAEVLKTNQTLKKLDFSHNKIGYEGVEALAKALEKNQSLQELDLTDNDIGNEEAKSLAEALKTNQSLQELDLRRNQINDEGVKSLAEALKINQSLQWLNLRSNKIDDEGAKAVVEALKENIALRKVELGSLDRIKDLLEPEVRKARILDKMQDAAYPTILELDLSNSGVDDQYLETLLNLPAARDLEVLNLLGNQITSQGVEKLALFLKDNPGLRILNLDYNQITTEGAMALAEVLKINWFSKTIDDLDFGFDREKDHDTKNIIKEIASRAIQIAQINLTRNGIDEEIFRAINDQVSENLSQRLDYLNQEVRNNILGLIVERITEKQGLQELDLAYNQITTEGVMAIAKALETNQTLKKLDLVGNQIGEQGAKAIAEMLEKNEGLEGLTLSDIPKEGFEEIRFSLYTKNITLEGLDLTNPEQNNLVKEYTSFNKHYVGHYKVIIKSLIEDNELGEESLDTPRQSGLRGSLILIKKDKEVKDLTAIRSSGHNKEIPDFIYEQLEKKGLQIRAFIDLDYRESDTGTVASKNIKIFKSLDPDNQQLPYFLASKKDDKVYLIDPSLTNLTPDFIEKVKQKFTTTLLPDNQVDSVTALSCNNQLLDLKSAATEPEQHPEELNRELIYFIARNLDQQLTFKGTFLGVPTKNHRSTLTIQEVNGEAKLGIQGKKLFTILPNFSSSPEKLNSFKEIILSKELPNEKRMHELKKLSKQINDISEKSKEGTGTTPAPNTNFTPIGAASSSGIREEPGIER